MSTSDRAQSMGTSLRCEACGVSVTSEVLMLEHLQGKKHKQAEKALAARAEGRYCECCAIAFTGPEQLTEHVKGKKHRERARAAGQKPAG